MISTLRTAGIALGCAALVITGSAASGVISIDTSPAAVTTAIEPVVFDTPLPQAPAPELQGQLVATLDALQAGGSFSGIKASYIQGGLGRIESATADRAFSNAVNKGYFPLSFDVLGIDQNGFMATADVTATAANGASATQNVQFIQGPSPTGWQISKGSALALLTAAT